MKIFISGQIDDSTSIKRLLDIAVSNGHEITHDWTKTDTFMGDESTKLANLKESEQRAFKDIKGVIDADVYILSSDNENVGKGMYVELGAALALRQAGVKDAPDVYIIGSLNHMSIFYLHPLVKRRESIEDVLDEISN